MYPRAPKCWPPPAGPLVVAGTDAETSTVPMQISTANLIVIELDTSFLGQPVYNLYAHLSEILVRKGSTSRRRK